MEEIQIRYAATGYSKFYDHRCALHIPAAILNLLHGKDPEQPCIDSKQCQRIGGRI